MPPAEPYNPLDKLKIADNIVHELVAQPCIPLPEIRFEGAGLYAIYYTGSFPAYAAAAGQNADGHCMQPIYVGKADPKGRRKGLGVLDAGIGTALFDRLSKHRRSIQEAENLNVADFQCRWLVVDAVWIGLGEHRAIQSFVPLWNTLLDGFGNNDPGRRRATQYRSGWDTVHPGREWAAKLAANPKTAAQFIAEMMQPHSQSDLESRASGQDEDDT